VLPSAFISAAVEGITDEALLRRICAYVGAQASAVYGKNGNTGNINVLPSGSSAIGGLDSLR
jgi:hypothetical protein